MDSRAWDDRYAAADLVWSREPNRFVAELAGPLPPGAAADIAAGEGRNAIWLAQQGWTVMATDYSTVAVERMRERAEAVLGPEALRLTALVADATAPPPAGRRHTTSCCSPTCSCRPTRCGRRCAPGSRPRAPRAGCCSWATPDETSNTAGEVRATPPCSTTPTRCIAMLAGGPAMDVELAEIRERPVETDDGVRQALDTLVLVTRS